MQCSVIDKQVSYSCIKEKNLLSLHAPTYQNMIYYIFQTWTNYYNNKLKYLLQFFDEGVSLNYSHSAYVDSKVTVGMVLHSGLIKDDKSKYTKTILDFISFVDGIPDFLPKHY